MEFGAPSGRPELRDHLTSIRFDPDDAEVLGFACESLVDSLDPRSDEYAICSELTAPAPQGLEIYASEGNHALLTLAFGSYAATINAHAKVNRLHGRPADLELITRGKRAEDMCVRMASEGHMAGILHDILSAPEGI